MFALPTSALVVVVAALLIAGVLAVNAWRRSRPRYPTVDEIYGEPKGMLWTCYSCGRDDGEHEDDCGARLIR